MNIELKKGKNEARLVILHPDLESWIVHSAHFIHVKLKDYGLPDDAKKLHDKLLESKKNLNFFAELILNIMNESLHIKALKRIIDQHHNYLC